MLVDSLWHVAPREARGSIAAHGLDPRRWNQQLPAGPALWLRYREALHHAASLAQADVWRIDATHPAWQQLHYPVPSDDASWRAPTAFMDPNALVLWATMHPSGLLVYSDA